ncbi:MAG TPA: hypothetical protein VIN07_08490, partial [Flavipsychrobacter sp.]
AVKSLKASVSRLMARPDVAEWVTGTEERVHNRMMRKFHNEHYDQFKEKLLTINEKRTVLTKIIKGETKRVRYVKVKYGVQKVEEDLPADTVLRAIDLDTRLENFYNYLTRSDTWRKAQNIYVNTPTLQQQVNILISQTNGKEEDKNTLVPRQIKSVIESPLQGDRGILAQETPQPEKPFTPEPTFPLEEERGTLAPDTCKEQNTTAASKAPHQLTTEPASSLMQKKNIKWLTTEPASSLTQKKNIKWLTKVNNSAKRSHCHHSKKHQAGDNSVKRSQPGLYTKPSSSG